MSARIALAGEGVVGGRVARRLAMVDETWQVLTVDTRVEAIEDRRPDLVVLAQPGPHADVAHRALRRGIPVVSLAGTLHDTRQMCDLDDLARSSGVPLVVGAARSPGLTDLLARHLASQLARCDEIHLAVHGTAGPSCAREHHRALSGFSMVLDGGQAVALRSGTGRELCWFPEPVGAYDCYRADLASPYLLARVFPEVARITGRQSANRRDRLTARLPMLTPPHREGGVGAVRVEVRGADAAGERITLVAGAAELVGTTAAATASAFGEAVLRDELPDGLVLPADPRLDVRGLLRAVERFGVRLQEFTGIPTTAP